MMDNEHGWFYYHDDVRDKINLNEILKTAEIICSVLGLELGKSWEAYVSELPKLPWSSMFLSSLDLDSFAEILKPNHLQARILHALYQGPSGLKSIHYNAVESCDEDVKVDPMEITFLKTLSEKRRSQWSLTLNKLGI